jgi:hypothetical protein
MPEAPHPNTDGRRWLKALGGVGFARLAEARLQAHHAIQALTAFAEAMAEPRPKDLHRSFDWDIGAQGLRTRPAEAAPDLTALFALPEFELRLERADVVVTTIRARGRGAAELREALRAATAGALGTAPPFPAPDFELPEHPTASGAPFDPGPEALAELAGWFTHADLAILRAVADFEGASETRVWPHHFDLATLVEAGEGQVGIGLSPGDGDIPHPYWYVRGYGHDGTDAAEQPDLPFGRWKEEGWPGAILEAPELVALDDAEAQSAAADAFLGTAVSTCVSLFG